MFVDANGDNWHKELVLGRFCEGEVLRVHNTSWIRDGMDPLFISDKF